MSMDIQSAVTTMQKTLAHATDGGPVTADVVNKMKGIVVDAVGKATGDDKVLLAEGIRDSMAEMNIELRGATSTGQLDRDELIDPAAQQAIRGIYTFLATTIAVDGESAAKRVAPEFVKKATTELNSGDGWYSGPTEDSVANVVDEFMRGFDWVGLDPVLFDRVQGAAMQRAGILLEALKPELDADGIAQVEMMLLGEPNAALQAQFDAAPAHEKSEARTHWGEAVQMWKGSHSYGLNRLAEAYETIMGSIDSAQKADPEQAGMKAATTAIVAFVVRELGSDLPVGAQIQAGAIEFQKIEDDGTWDLAAVPGAQSHDPKDWAMAYVPLGFGNPGDSPIVFVEKVGEDWVPRLQLPIREVVP